jgi:hypothetical protein
VLPCPPGHQLQHQLLLLLLLLLESSHLQTCWLSLCLHRCCWTAAAAALPQALLPCYRLQMQSCSCCWHAQHLLLHLAVAAAAAAVHCCRRQSSGGYLPYPSAAREQQLSKPPCHQPRLPLPLLLPAAQLLRPLLLLCKKH